MKLFEFRAVIIFFFLTVIIFSGCVSSNSHVKQNTFQTVVQTSENKTSFPVFELPIPQNVEQKNYLGISSGWGKFKITQIKSPVILIAVFSTDCPHCRNTAPKLNELYQTIQTRADLKEKIKLIGLLDSSPSQVASFRARYNLSFPLFPGQDNVITHLLDIKSLPKFYGIKNNEDGTIEEFYNKTGEFWFWNESRFLEKIITLSKLETGR